MKKKLLLIVLSSFMISGCASGGVSQEQYESVVTERDELKSELEALKANEYSDKTADITKETEAIKNEEDESKGNVEIIAEYTLPDGIGWYTRHFMVIKNNTNKTVDVSTSSLAYAEDGNMIGAADASFDALGSGCTSVLYEAFETSDPISSYETNFKETPSEYYDSVIQDLSFVQNDVDGGSVFQVTNNGSKPAEFVEGYALFFFGDELVNYESAYFTNDDSIINPGETISKQLTTSVNFDRIEFYLTGRR